jgi:hypothetical protein
MDDELFDPHTGWLVPGRHYVDFGDLAVFAPPGDRRRVETFKGIQILLSAVKELLPSGDMFIAGTFVSRQPGPVDPPMIAVVPHDSSALEAWNDAEDARFTALQSLHDVIVGSLGPDYFPVMHPLSGLLEAYYCPPESAVEFVSFMGAVTTSDGEDIVGARGVVEVEW